MYLGQGTMGAILCVCVYLGQGTMGAILCVCVCVPWPGYETFRTAQGPISSTQLKGQTSMLMVPEKFPISHVTMSPWLTH